MVKEVILAVAVGFIAFELIEHVVFPLFWSLKNRKKGSVSGETGMLGKVAKVKAWDKTEGRVVIGGELWKAVGEVPLSRGDKAVIERVDGLTLMVKPFKDRGVEEHRRPGARPSRPPEETWDLPTKAERSKV